MLHFITFIIIYVKQQQKLVMTTYIVTQLTSLSEKINTVAVEMFINLQKQW